MGRGYKQAARACLRSWAHLAPVVPCLMPGLEMEAWPLWPCPYPSISSLFPHTLIELLFGVHSRLSTERPQGSFPVPKWA